MAFVPTHDFCLEKNSDDEYELIVTDTTDVYDNPDNLTGWQNAATILAADVTEATLTVTVTESDGSETEYEIDVLDQIPDPVTGQIEFDPLTTVTINDGIYKVLYTVKTASVTYTSCVVKVLYPAVGCCISTLVKQLKNNIANVKLYDTVNKIKAYEHSLKEATKTLDTESIKSILTLLETYCDYDVDCGCN